MTTPTMRAHLLRGPGEPDAFELVERPLTDPESGWVRVRVRAFGLNRSELFSRRGMSSPDFSYPRVLGLECVGEVDHGGDTDLEAGERVIALMGGMGREFDGSYATHTTVPRSQVFRVGPLEFDWADLGALPETYNTAWGVCHENLQLKPQDRVLVRGGTSALGMAAVDIAHDLGCRVVSTTRNPDKLELLRERSPGEVMLDGDDLAARVLDEFGQVTAVVECVGSKQTVESSCACMPDGGRLGLVGQLGEDWESPYRPVVPSTVRAEFTRSDLVTSPRDDARMAAILASVADGQVRPNIWRTFEFEELSEAHRVMGANEAIGKLVVVVD